MGEEQPGTEDWLGKNVKDGVGNDLAVDIGDTGTVSDTPDNGVDGPDDKSESTNGSEKVTNLATLGHGRATAVDDENPDDDEVGEAGHGVPSPLLAGALGAESSKETGQDHDDVGNNGEESVSTAETSKETEVQEEKRSGKRPINVTGPVDLTVDVLLGVWDVLVGLGDGRLVVRDTVSSGLCIISTLLSLNKV